ncbi:MAG: hypothetical protein EZS28_010273 [Streblomastix strix]|uniref:Uncharacterized protein n=1 Tax=Streblomastix strix TaxID=222440 RepID=A0A5J4WIM0_9EUKA|nr:MAG: hypothetical protein EZS28_010273 [Streblomastix strix]
MSSLTEQQIQQIVDEEETKAGREFEAEKGVSGSGAGGQGMTEFDLNQIEKEARQEFEAERSYGAGELSSAGGGLIEIDGMVDDYDYYESQSTRQDRMKPRAKAFRTLPFHPSMIQRTRKNGGPQFREEAVGVHATLIVNLNRDIKKINSVSEQDLDDNAATPDNVVVYDKKRNAIYSVYGYSTAVGFGDPEHQHKRNWKKQYYSDVNDLERIALAAKLKQQGIKGDKQGQISQRRSTFPNVPPIVPPNMPPIQALPELLPLNLPLNLPPNLLLHQQPK